MKLFLRPVQLSSLLTLFRNRDSRISSIAVIFFILISCRHTPDPPGIPEFIPQYYWNYYLRGIAYTLEGSWEFARHDFEVAIGQRDGAIWPEPTEKRRTKTYGLHFLDNYYPRRELGICYFKLGMLDAAESELTTSLEMLPSSRAGIYLNRVREARYRQRSDIRPDAIQIDIDDIPELPYLNTPYVRLSGTISSPYRISHVTVNDRPKFIDSAEERYRVDQKISLKNGPHNLGIFARDLAGNSAQWQEQIIIDTIGPTVSISPSDSNPKEEAVVNITDNIALAELEIDGRRIVAHATDEKGHVEAIPMKPPRTIHIKAIDRAGNETHWNVHTGDLTRAALESLKYHPDTRLAFAGPLSEHHYQTQQAAPLGNTTPVLPAAHSNTAANQHASDASWTLAQGILDKMRTTDNIKPVLRIYPDVQEATSVTSDLFVLDVSGEDSGYIDSFVIFINGKREARSIREDRVRNYRFTQTLELAPGANHLKILVADWAGNSDQKTVTVNRKMPHQARRDLRMTLQMIVDLADKQEGGDNSSKNLIAFLNAMIDRRNTAVSGIDLNSYLKRMFLRPESPRFNLIERDPEIIERLLLEQQLIHSSLADYRAAVSAGKIKLAEWLLQGKISFWGGNDEWVLNGILVDVQTGRQIMATDIQFEGFEREQIEFRLQTFVDKLTQRIPLHSSTVETMHKKGIILPFGQADSIHEDFRILFISKDEPFITFADPIDYKGKWIQGVATAVSADQTLVRILPENALDRIRQGDLAIIR